MDRPHYIYIGQKEIVSIPSVSENWEINPSCSHGMKIKVLNTVQRVVDTLILGLVWVNKVNSDVFLFWVSL